MTSLPARAPLIGTPPAGSGAMPVHVGAALLAVEAERVHPFGRDGAATALANAVHGALEREDSSSVTSLTRL